MELQLELVREIILRFLNLIGFRQDETRAIYNNMVEDLEEQVAKLTRAHESESVQVLQLQQHNQILTQVRLSWLHALSPLTVSTPHLFVCTVCVCMCVCALCMLCVCRR